jgi:hypothetical protein
MHHRRSAVGGMIFQPLLNDGELSKKVRKRVVHTRVANKKKLENAEM